MVEIRTQAEYSRALKAALHGASPGLIRDALNDADEYFHAERSQNPDLSEVEIVQLVIENYGTPEEVAAEYRATEEQVSAAFDLHATSSSPELEQGAMNAIFGVFTDPRAYGALFYMFLSLALGVFYFTWVVTGLSVSFGLMILIIGIPILLLFIGSVRVLAHVEGRLVEALLGVRMPRRMPYAPTDRPLWERIKYTFTDYRTWSAMMYMVLMLPLGIAYFVLAVTGLSVSVSFLFSPIGYLFYDTQDFNPDTFLGFGDPTIMQFLGDGHVMGWQVAIVCLLGAVGLVLMMHAARGIGWFHGKIAENLLVRI